MTLKSTHLFLKARRILRRNQFVYDLVRTIRYGPLYGIRVQRVRRSLLRRAETENWLMLNLGSGGKRIPNMINLDVTPVTGPDVVGDGYSLPFRDGTFDAVFCEYVIEHVPDPEGFIAAASHALKPDGIFYLEIPFLQPLHGEGADFTRWTREGFIRAAERAGLQILEIGVHVGPAFTLYWILKNWIAALLSFGIRPLYEVFRYLLSWFLAPLMLLDIVMLRLPQSEELANGFYVVATPKLIKPNHAGYARLQPKQTSRTS